MTRAEALETEIRATYLYGPIHDDLGHHVANGCVVDGEAWPCRRLIRLGGHTTIPRRTR